MADAAAAAAASYELRYSRALVRSAVRAFVGWRLVVRDRRLSLAQGLLAVFAAVLASGGAWGRAALLVMIAAAVPALALVGWGAHLTAKLRTLRAMGAPVATVTIEADGLRFRSGAGEGALAFNDVMAWRERPDFWMLLTATNRFTILPTADLPELVLSDLRGRLEEVARDR